MYHFISQDLIKAVVSSSEGATPYFRGRQEGGGGPAHRPMKGPRGGDIKKISPVTGKPIYYKKWSPDHKSRTLTISHGPQPGYERYRHSPEHAIGRTEEGHHIHAVPTEENKRGYKESYKWKDHLDAHQAHFALAMYLQSLLAERNRKGLSTTHLRKLIESHHKFADYHKDQQLTKQRKKLKKDKVKKSFLYIEA